MNHILGFFNHSVFAPSVFSGLPKWATQYSLPRVRRALRDNAAALSTTIPLKCHGRGEVKSRFPSVFFLLPPLAHVSHHPPPGKKKKENPTPSSNNIRPPGCISHSSLLTFHLTSLFFSCPTCLLFRAPSRSRLHTPPPPPPLKRLGPLYEQRHSAEQRQGHMGKKRICSPCHMTHHQLMFSPPRLWRTLPNVVFFCLFLYFGEQ